MGLKNGNILTLIQLIETLTNMKHQRIGKKYLYIQDSSKSEQKISKIKHIALT